jgi:hypothetical protein
MEVSCIGNIVGVQYGQVKTGSRGLHEDLLSTWMFGQEK